ncbi:hypothetical protein A5634_22290 [Mycobacterium asiaticum]|uniref:Uncharacterized protein n=1 Tax=Mycobacterium asiaticum TaxID=1790 RepID=A0A1A3P346_MYCAS|nr:hypothetical protein [Mycobacterium asiaticum]OBK27699.1 hypothetical protein A5634_22290 [Mycobacterium asiaticum]
MTTTKPKPITDRLVANVGADIVEAASHITNPSIPGHARYRADLAIDRATNPRLIDRGAAPPLVLAIGAAIVRRLAMRHLMTWRGPDPIENAFNPPDDTTVWHADAILDQCRCGVLWGLRPEELGVGIRDGAFEEIDPPVQPAPTLTPRQANCMLTCLQLADARITDHGERLERADHWCGKHDFTTGLEAMSAGVELVALLAGWTDNPELTYETLTTDLLTIHEDE